MQRFALFLLFLVLLAGCTPRVYQAPEFNNVASRHKTVAILPAEVTIQLRPNQARNTTPEQMDDMRRRTAYAMQESMHGWFLRRSDRFKYTVSFQDPTQTNARLKDGGIAWNDLKNTDRARLAQVLGVDAVMQSTLQMEKPMSEGAGIAVGLLTGFWGPTNNVQATVNIHDGTSGNLMWKYENRINGSVGSSPVRLTDQLLRNVARRFPYSPRLQD